MYCVELDTHANSFKIGLPAEVGQCVYSWNWIRVARWHTVITVGVDPLRLLLLCNTIVHIRSAHNWLGRDLFKKYSICAYLVASPLQKPQVTGYTQWSQCSLPDCIHCPCYCALHVINSSICAITFVLCCITTFAVAFINNTTSCNSAAYTFAQ